jgi:hypothetical protein
VYAHAGDKDRALDWLERAFEERDFLMTNLNTSSDWQLLHEEKRYTDLVNRLNFPKT